MSISVIKVLNNEIVLTSANTVYDSKLVLVTNPTDGVVALSVNFDTPLNSGANSANVSIVGGTSLVIEKAPADTLTGTGLVGVPIAYKN